MRTCWCSDPSLDTAGKIKHAFKINFARFLFFFFNIAPRKLKITRVAHICTSLYISLGSAA